MPKEVSWSQSGCLLSQQNLRVGQAAHQLLVTASAGAWQQSPSRIQAADTDSGSGLKQI